MVTNTEDREQLRREAQDKVSTLMRELDIIHIHAYRKDGYDDIAWEEHKRVRTDYI